MNIRKIKMEDTNSYLEMLLNLDKETKFMMFEPQERSKSIDIARRKIENTIKGDNLILVATEGTEIIGFLSVKRGVPRRIRHTGYVVVGIREKYRGMGIGKRWSALVYRLWVQWIYGAVEFWKLGNKILV